jgi:hypothetical protein
MRSFFEKFTNRPGDQIDRQLREDAGVRSAPADLHDFIMNAVQREAVAPAIPRSSRGVFLPLALTLLPIGAVCIAFGLFLPRHNHRQTVPPSNVSVALSAPGAALEFRENVAATLPSALTPLSDELARVQRDLDRTADFILASVP